DAASRVRAAWKSNSPGLLDSPVRNAIRRRSAARSTPWAARAAATSTVLDRYRALCAGEPCLPSPEAPRGTRTKRRAHTLSMASSGFFFGRNQGGDSAPIGAEILSRCPANVFACDFSDSVQILVH